MLVSHIREEYRLRVFQNRMLRKMIGPGREEVTGGCRKAPIEKVHDFYPSPNTVMLIKCRMMR
jgi:hypothetical protein